MAIATGIVSAVASAAKVAEVIAERAERGEILDLGAARQNAENLNGILGRLLAFQHAADLLDANPAFRRLVREAFEDDD